MQGIQQKLERVHGGNAVGQGECLDFSVNTNPLGFPESIHSTILHSTGAIGSYPDPDARDLRLAVGAYHKLPIDMILPVNGSAELIHLLMNFRPLSKVLIVGPAFTEYAWAAERCRAEVLSVFTEEADRFRLRPDRLDWPRLLKGVDRVFLCNPNNPTGVACSREEISQIAVHCLDAGALLIVDEAFVEFAPARDRISAVPLVSQWNHVVVMNSLTKFFAIPGLRLGYAVAGANLIEGLRAAQPMWPLNTFALAVGERLFSETDYWDRSRREVVRLRERFETTLREIPGIRPFPSVTNFILCKLENLELTSDDLCQRLARRGILIRNCDSFPGLTPGRFIRLAVKRSDENERLAHLLREVLEDAG